MNAINAYNRLNGNVAGLRKASEKLSSGYRINRAGDDAAGLAISEKMRSQIRGLNQAVRNSQDGINMIQTFEGAAQETHSILQRMKELAMESANGTYDNATDRAAIQLEFEQLNDELNQIADTDFNGTVVLNGGEMADGLKQVDGNFDYRMKADQVAEENAKLLANAQAEAQKKIDAAQKAFDSAKAQYDATTGRDLCLDGNAVQWNTVDDNAYTTAVAKDLFDKATDGTDSLTDLGVDSFEVQFKFDGTDWKVDKAWYVNGDGEDVEVDLSASDLKDANINTTANGGFVVNDSKLGNAIFAASGAAENDVVTLTYTNTASASFAPTNIGMDEETLRDGVGLSAAPTLALDAGVTDAAIANDASLMDALTKLDKASVDFQYSTAGITGTISDDSLILTQDDPTKGVFTISYNNPDGKEVKLATITMDDPAGKSTASVKTAEVDINANAGAIAAGSVTFTYDGTKWDDGAGNATATVGDATFDPTAALQGNAVKGDKVTFTYGDIANGAAGKATVAGTFSEGTVGKVSFGIALDEGNYDVSNTKPTIDPSTSPDGTDATAIDKAYEDTKAALAAAKAAMPKTIEDLGDLSGVTKADAYDNSTARMTYTDNITLQTGARTKDAVNFTFKYNTEDTADMGNLKANLNLSAREDGLNTANLTLANQKDANYAIDQIDKAINKTSMVRATFGAIQNRLEHKITNLTTTSENLTEAESSIRDTDMASEMMNYTKFNILQQAAQSMLAQANQQPQSILQLLG